MLSCTSCGLSEGRTRVVPGEGPEDAEIMFIGEAPGFNEDKQGRPFVGAAGQFLEGLLSAGGLRREQVYIANVVKCRPPNNRDPLPTEIAACKPWLDQQMEMLRPRVVVTLGRFSMARWFPGQSISRIHGRPEERDGLTVVPMFHPAAALHQQALKATITEDFRRLPKLLEQLRQVDTASQPAPSDSDPAAAAEPRPEQLSLF
ncbi:MAG: uracil-DNA glycosylase [Dehalococcoidia bacterium]|nr:uracil-DNA glycosylase [Dehalococcoidia bacterium]